MRNREQKLVVTFSTTTAAIAAETLCHRAGVPGRLIPVPVDISAGCGMAWAMPPEAKEAFEKATRNRLVPAGWYERML